MSISTPIGYLYWHTTSSILFLLTLFNLASKLYSRIEASKDAPAEFTSLPVSRYNTNTSSVTSHSYKKDISHSEAPPKTSTLNRLGKALSAGYSRYFLLTSLPIPNLRFWKKSKDTGGIPTTELFWTIGYTVGTLILSFYGTSWDISAYSNQAAWIAVAQIPLIIALAGKNNLISWLTGISYEKLNFLHRAAGRVCLVGAWIHTGGHLYLNQGINHVRWQLPYLQWGVIGLFTFTLLTTLSFRWLRHRFYELFLISHVILVAVTLVAFVFHWNAVGVWIYPGVGLWAADRISRVLRLLLLNRLWAVSPSPSARNLPSTATLTSLTPSTILVTFTSPCQYLSWSAGQHFYVVMPGMARFPWEAHPFTAATIPGDVISMKQRELTFIVRVRDGFTKRMKERLDLERKVRGLGIEVEVKIEVPAAVEGPYGISRSLNHCEAVLIVVGGSGVSFAISHLLQTIKEAKEGRSMVKTIRILWMVKSRLHLNWISPILLENVHSIPTTLQVQLHLHVTKHYPRLSAGLPTNPDNIDDVPWQDYMAAKAVEPRRMSRLMSSLSWATWTGPLDRRFSGPGTRRGSLTVLPTEIGKLHPAKQLPKSTNNEFTTDTKVQLQVSIVPAFSWSEGYNDASTFPMTVHDESIFGRSQRLLSEAGPGDIGLDAFLDTTLSPRSTSKPLTPRESRPSIPGITPPPRSRQVSIVERSPQRSGSIHQNLKEPYRKPSNVGDYNRQSTGNLLSVALNSNQEVGTSYPIPMRKASSAQSYQSHFSINSETPLTQYPPSKPHHRLGDLTPGIEESGAKTFADDEPLRRRLSYGLEGIVVWREGRADLCGAIEEMMEFAGDDGKVSVGVCGPKSLLESTRRAVRDVSSLKNVMDGKARVELHMETFGW